MNCIEARQHWNLYHDSEGDADLHFRISEHLAECPQCALWFAQQSRLENLLADKLRPDTPTPELWDAVVRHCGLKRRRPTRRGLLLAGVAASLILLAGITWYAVHSAGAPAPDMAKLSAQWHRRLEVGDEMPQFRSHSDLEVEGYLRQRVSFPVRCPPRKDAGFAVQGAGVFRLADQSAAYLAGYVDAAPVSIFVLQRDSMTAFPRQQEALATQKTHRCQEGQYAMVMGIIDKNAVLVIGQTDTARLERVLSAYGSYPD